MLRHVHANVYFVWSQTRFHLFQTCFVLRGMRIREYSTESLRNPSVTPNMEGSLLPWLFSPPELDNMQRGNQNTQNAQNLSNNLDDDQPQQQRVPPNPSHGQWLQGPPLNPHAIAIHGHFAAGMRQPPTVLPQPSQSTPYSQRNLNYPAPVGGVPLSTNSSSRWPRCILPGCTQPVFFDSRIQEQLDYCEAHISAAITLGFAALCEQCKRLPARDDSKYCSQVCSSADVVALCKRCRRFPARDDSKYCSPGCSSADVVGSSVVRQPPIVPQGFVAACQDCRRPMQNATHRFCSVECEDANCARPALP
ncbi:hypothetical protein F5148DRAFT_1235955 [Russula earlei]|uniref:Uncharacterized protein n=1 Tax=Russula earlei TaxID=71964 RepID=A0ACC0TX70_9AGAM|nr:hypothetical protein F5148DRAFT_1235955 [Russula earlei]